MEYLYSGILSATKRREVLEQATTWMNLKNILLSERSQAQTLPYAGQKNPQKQNYISGSWRIGKGENDY